jgi:plastocyanin
VIRRALLLALLALAGGALLPQHDAAAQAMPTIRMLPASGSQPARYAPANVTIQVFGTVVWVSDDNEDDHNVVIPGVYIGRASYGRGEGDTITFDTPGVFPYYCEPHPYMTGVITVLAAPAFRVALPVAVDARAW